MDNFWEDLNSINLIIGPIGFIISIISYLKIKKVDKSLNSQKERILFNKKIQTIRQGD